MIWFWIILILVQIILAVLFYLFIDYNCDKIDNWQKIFYSIISLVPIVGLIYFIIRWAVLIMDMSKVPYLPDTKINRFLFGSKFK